MPAKNEACTGRGISRITRPCRSKDRRAVEHRHDRPKSRRQDERGEHGVSGRLGPHQQRAGPAEPRRESVAAAAAQARLRDERSVRSRADLYRSDHYSYASKGIPIIFFTTGLHPDYHANTDEVSKIEFPKMTRVTQLVYETALARGESGSSARARQQRAPSREGNAVVTRPLLVIFLTIFVNLVGFGIIIPLLPFYAERFGASPLVIGLLFGVFSLCQLVASPALGDLSDRYGRRPVLIFSLLGTVVSFVMLALAQSDHDAVPRAHRRRTLGRQHLDRARVRRRHHRAEGPRACVRADRRGVRPRIHFRSGAERRACRTSATRRRSGRPRR